MASTSKCPYCGSTVRSDEKKCPSCGAENRQYVADTPRTIFNPKTIDELKEYCAERGMPLLRMRFFIGEDYKKPKAFGIYRDGRDVVVYKNKADGSRAIRYRGPDEEHAVSEIFLKLLDECHNRGIYPDGKPIERSAGGKKGSRGKKKELSGCLLYVAAPLMLAAFIIFLFGFLIPPLRKRKLSKAGVWPEKRLGSKKELPPSGRFNLLDLLAYTWNSFLYGEPGKETALTPREKKVDSTTWLSTGGQFLRGLLLVLLILAIILSIVGLVHRNDGYYRPGDGYVYYNDAGDWYRCSDDDGTDWVEIGSAPENYQDYYLGEDWDSDWGVVDVQDSYVWYDNHHSESGSSDSDSGSSSSGSDYVSWSDSDTNWDNDW